MQDQLGTPLHAIGECDGDIVTTLRENDVRARLSSQVHEVEEDDDEVFCPGEINSASTDYWRGQIELNSDYTLFKLDTGSAVTVLSDNAQWLRSIDLTETSHTFRGPGNIRLPVKGQFHATYVKIRTNQHYRACLCLEQSNMFPTQ